ncbi:MAG: hypothetical protein IT270_00655 [Saprospiraceae bacterium]|nr:hypothetical protein [Saprospiraceae bacterium]
MVQRLTTAVLLLASIFHWSCQNKQMPEDASVWNKVSVNLSRLDENGLAGPSNGKVAVNYEFCIPANDKHWKAVQRIDTTAQKMAGSPGRIGCDKQSWLIVGSTHQPNYKRVLYDLASLTYVAKIQETFWE